jgi:hypothetical protein
LALTIHPHQSSAEVKERVDLYLYSPSLPPWKVTEKKLPFNIAMMIIITGTTYNKNCNNNSDNGYDDDDYYYDSNNNNKNMSQKTAKFLQKLQLPRFIS